MRAERVTPAEYAAALGGCESHKYNTVEFALLNACKCDGCGEADADEAAGVHFLLFRDTKVRLGLILGLRGGLFLSPFSAPFGGFTAQRECRVSHFQNAGAALKEYAGGREVRITLPPTFYSPNNIARQTAALLGHSRGGWTDINHHYLLPTGATTPDRGLMWPNARRNLAAAMRAGLTFTELNAADNSDLARVYEVIRLNHLHRGHPLNMSLDEVARTAPMMNARIFMLSLDGQDVAALYMHQPAEGIGQIIYLGDAPGYQRLRPMNLLLANALSACASSGLRIVDLGISSVQGQIDAGLCDFKESMGFRPTLRPTIII